MTDEMATCQCGHPVPGEPVGTSQEDREPCTECGSTNRSVPGAASLLGESHLGIATSAQLQVVRHWVRLLETADELIQANHHEVSIVVAHTACEVIVQRAVSMAFKNRNIEDLESPIDGFVTSYSLNNERVRRFYSALTGDDQIVNQSFWEQFRKSVKRRNDIVHRGLLSNSSIPVEQQARESLASCSAFVSYIEAHNSLA